MRDKLFICQRCQSRIKKKTPECEVEFEWNDESFKDFKKKAKKIDERLKLVMTSCLGPCPKKKVSYQRLADGKIESEGCYSAKYNEDEIFKHLIKNK